MQACWAYKLVGYGGWGKNWTMSPPQAEAGIVVESVVRGTRATLKRKARRVMQKVMQLRFQKEKKAVRNEQPLMIMLRWIYFKSPTMFSGRTHSSNCLSVT